MKDLVLYESLFEIDIMSYTVEINKDKFWRTRRLRKINDIDPFFGDETVSPRSARSCPRYPNASRGKSWAIMYLRTCF